jgi:dCMP deaminase
MILGITGTLGAGKGTIVEFLKQKGFKHFSVREFLIQEINRRGLQVNRDSMVALANQLREANSPSYIVKQLLEQAKNSEHAIIESIRTPAEAELIKKGGFLLAVDALPQLRYTRIITRQSETDNISFDEFLAQEKREMHSIDPNHQNLSKCIQMANFVLENNKDLEHLKKQIEIVLEKIKTTKQEPEKYVRLSWDKYFMEIVKTVAKRATCDRGRSGCVIIKDKQILVTGYVGSPVGLPHCDDVGHQMKKMIHEDDSISQHCVRTIHAEQNAICQAAKLGISLKDSTLYCKMTPCRVCAMLIINVGIKRVVCEKKYHQGEESEEMFKQAGIQLDIINDEVEKYEKM